MAPPPLGLCRGQQAPPGREFEGEYHADGDRLAMQEPVGKAAGRFQGMAESVAEIKKRTLPSLALVAAHNGGLGAAGYGHRVFARRISRSCRSEDFTPVRFQP